MKHLNKIASAFCAAALGMLALTSCEGGELYSVNAPDWIPAKVDSIKKANTPEELVGMVDDYYTIGNTDYSSGWWTSFSKYYVIPDGAKWNAEINVYPNPDNVYYKNLCLVVSNNVDRGGDGYAEYGAYRFDATGDSVKWNSQWGKLWFKYTTSTLNLSPDADNKDANAQKLAGKMTLTVDRSKDGEFIIKMVNGSATKTYNQPYELGPGEDIRCFLVADGSYLQFLTTNIVPIGGCTSREDKLPLSMVLNNVPDEVDQGSSLADVVANVTATVTFEQGVVLENVPASDLIFEVVPDVETLGEKTLVAVYNKTFKGENTTPIVASAKFSVVPVIESIEVTKAPKFTTYSIFNSVVTEGLARDLAFNPAGMEVTATYGDGTKEVVDNSKLSFSTVPAEAGTYNVTVTTKNGRTATVSGISVAESEATLKHLSPAKLGAEDNSTPWWSAFTEDVKVPAGATYQVNFTNYAGGSNWNNFVIILRNAAMAEYAVVRADNYGWGNGYAAAMVGPGQNWGAWLPAMNGAECTAYITNCANGTADVQVIMNGNDGNTYIQYYLGINTVDAGDLQFAFTVDGSHIVFE